MRCLISKTIRFNKIAKLDRKCYKVDSLVKNGTLSKNIWLPKLKTFSKSILNNKNQ